ncbi:MAG TPA: hypothetical protein VGL92_16595 [Acidimicrobiia bacterium]|jgi:hypothetical protein
MSQVKADLAEVGAKIDQLAEAQRRALVDKLDAMTKAELQALADERAIAGVDQASQTKDEMVATIRQALLG